ncbi:MAG TPA: antitoxin VapB family protein [Nitrososphaeraceae archaeon]
MNELNIRTTISLSKQNYKRLQNLGKVPESFNDVISRLLHQSEKERKEGVKETI